jgi:hypothetical protein
MWNVGWSSDLSCNNLCSETFKFYFLVDKANPLKLYYAGSTDTLAINDRQAAHKRDFDKIKRMLGPDVDIANRVEIEVLRGRTYSQVKTMEHCFQMQQREFRPCCWWRLQARPFPSSFQVGRRARTGAWHSSDSHSSASTERSG